MQQRKRKKHFGNSNIDFEDFKNIANVKAFAIFLVFLCFIDIIFFYFTKFSIHTDFFYIFLSNIAISLIFTSLFLLFHLAGLIISYVFIFIISFITLFEITMYRTYSLIISPTSAIANFDSVIKNYGNEFVRVIFQNLPAILIYLIAYVAFILITNKILLDDERSIAYWSDRFKFGFAKFAIGILGIVLFILSSTLVYMSKDFTSNTIRYGLKTAMLNRNLPSRTMISVDSGSEKIVYDESANSIYNVLNFDFAKMAEEDNDQNRANINRYLSTIKPTKKNDFTGIFKGKNLILICAEAYSHYVIDEKLTPTLYRLTNNGFRFNDFYVPSWGGSTSSGEFAFLTGLVPTYGPDSMRVTKDKNMYFTMPNMLKRNGYTTGAYHNGTYRFYDRDKTHKKNIGFDYYIACDNGLEKIAGNWPTDEQMISKTFDTYVDKKPFCMYYMTISGHAFYNKREDYRVVKSIKKVKERYGDKYPEQVENYICYQIYLEEALTSLMNKLEEHEMLDDTVICMVSDHYPYGLSAASFTKNVDYLPYLYGKNDMDEFETDFNKPVLWCGELETKYKDVKKDIDTPTSSLDLLPTLLNLFGERYDSRLLSGRDVLADGDAETVVIYNSGAFKSEKGKNSIVKRKFTPSQGYTYDKNYVLTMTEYTKNRILFAQYCVDNDYYNYLFK